MASIDKRADELLAELTGHPKSGAFLRSALGIGDDDFWERVEHLRALGKIVVGRGHGGTFVRMDAERAELLSKLPDDGALLANGRVKATLNWTDDRYWRVHGDLLQRGLIRVGPGRGGTVGRAFHDEAPPTAAPSQRPATPASDAAESAWYPIIAHELQHAWGSDFSDRLTEVTAWQGRRDTGGRWTRPDITAVTRRSHRLLPSSVFEVWTFEVKKPGDWSILGVHEASAHGRQSNRAVLLLVANGTADNLNSDERSELDACKAEAVRLGVGLLVAYAPHAYLDWEWLVEPEPQAAAPISIAKFLETQLSSPACAAIERWWLGDPNGNDATR